MRRALPLVALLALGAVFAPPLQARDASVEGMMAFADHLFETGDYYRAITEYERVVFFHPDAPAALTARYQIGMSYYKGGKYSLAARHFGNLAERDPDGAVGRKAALMAAESRYKDGDYRSAIAALGAFLERHPAGPDTDSALLLLGRCHLREGDWKRAAEVFESVPPGSASGGAAGGLALGARKYPDVRMKSPALAGALSALVPGAGQLYVGRSRDAAGAFLLNALFVWAAVEAFDRGNNVTGGILVAFEAGWYSGNIFNAVGGAHKHNRRVRQEYLDDLQNRFGRSGDGNSRGLFVRAFTIRY